MSLLEREPVIVEGLVRYWQFVLAGFGAAFAAVRQLIITPHKRLTAVEQHVCTVDMRLDGLADSMNEVRIAQARMSDAHTAALNALTARIDRIFEQHK